MKKSELERIKRFVRVEMKKGRDPQHDFGHVERVVKNARKMVGFLGLDSEIDKNLLSAACYLHDIGHGHFSPSFFNYFFEKGLSKKVLPGVLGGFDLNLKEKKTIEEAVYNSSYSFPFKRLNREKDIYSQILQDADTVDFFSLEREKSFLESKNRFLFYRLLSPFSSWTFKYGRKNLRKYLNFAQLANKFYV